MYGLTKHSTNILFSDKHGPAVFSATMSRLRFEFLFSHIYFEEFEENDEKWKNDRFAAMKDFFEALNEKFGKALTHEDYISLEETLYLMRTQSAMKQYNPNKPAKYGILFKSLICARYPYTFQTFVYAGKPTEQPNEFYVKGTINYIKRLVTNLEQYQSICGRKISMDRLYKSFEVAEWLLKWNVTMIGTIMSNRVRFPPEIKPATN